jgi:hypothetical protein
VLRGQFEERLANIVPLRGKAESDQAFHGELFYYCSASGLTGIMTSRSFWATNLRHMNDASELAYGGELVKDRISAYLGEDLDSNQAEFLWGLLPLLNPFGKDYDAYAVCFSQTPNDLGQWRGYADGGRGYAVGLSADGLRHKVCVRVADAEMPWFGRVIYDRTEQDAILAGLISVVMDMWGELKPGPTYDRDLNALKFAARQVFGEVIPFLKNPSFAAEQEWRLLVLSLPPLDADDIDYHVKVRERDRRLYPYVEFVARETEFDGVQSTPVKRDPKEPRLPLPVTSVLAGPLVDLKTEAPALRLLLAAGGVNAPVKHSDIPLR